MAKKRPFLTDVKTLRARARKHIEQGAITESYRADRKTVVKLLNEALATEIICVLRYRRHHFMAAGINADSVAQEFLTHANEEQQHADQHPDHAPDDGGDRELLHDPVVVGGFAARHAGRLPGGVPGAMLAAGSRPELTCIKSGL
jgi:bacterioferritin